MIKYRKDIDGLRGLSILLVIFFHAKIPLFSGGYLGVDIFFVISGYLITSIILNSYSKNKFSLKYFYERRIRRIIPALYGVLFFLCIYSFFFQSPYFSKDLSQSIFFTPIFLQNFLNIYESSNYFNLSYDFKSLGHVWSLSIEEQFYFLYPIIFLFIYNISIKNLKYFLFFLFSISLIYYIYLDFYSSSKSFLFFFTPSRIWEILAGCLVAINFTNLKKSKYVNIIGIFLILIPVFFQNIFEQNIFSRLMVVFGASLLLINTFKYKECRINNLLSSNYLVYIGLISYSLYLWHVPVYSIYRDLFTFELKYYENLLLLIVSLLISYLSFKYVETPFRSKNKISNQFIYSFFLIGIIFFTLFGFLGHKLNGFEKIKINSLPLEKKVFYISFMDERKKIKEFRKNLKINENYSILVIGDSLASDVVNSLETQDIKAKRLNLNGPCFEKIIMKKSACGISLNELLEKSKKSKTVIISSDFANENSETGAIKLYNYLIKKNLSVKIIGSLNFKYVSSSSFRYAKYNFYQEQKKFYYNNIQPNTFKINKILKKNTNKDFIEKLNFFCNFKFKECKMYNEEFKPMFYDTKHMTINGYYVFGKYLKNLL